MLGTRLPKSLALRGWHEVTPGHTPPEKENSLHLGAVGKSRGSGSIYHVATLKPCAGGGGGRDLRD